MKNIIASSKEIKTQVVSPDTNILNNNNIKVASICSGIGAFEQALKNRSIPHTNEYMVEIDRYARLTYLANHYVNNVYEDLTKLNPKKLTYVDLLFLSFPCQPFSNQGLRRGFNDTRGTLTFYGLNIVKIYKPKYIIFENVKGMLSHDKGNTFKVILAAFKELGYNVKYEVLNSKNFKTPQNRERLFLVCIRKDIKQEFEFPKPNPVTTAVNDYIEVGADYSDCLYDATGRVPHVTKVKTDIVKLYQLPHIKFSSDRRICSTDGIAPCIVASSAKTKFYDTKNKLFRFLNIDEMAAIQGFPQDFEFPVSKTQKKKQIGNSITIPVLEAILENLLPEYIPENSQVVNQQNTCTYDTVNVSNKTVSVKESFANFYKKIDIYNQAHQNNKAGVVFTPRSVAKTMIEELSPSMDETFFEPSVGSGVFIIALLEFIIEKYSPSDLELKSYIENMLYYADIDSGSVEFTSMLVKEFMLQNYQISALSLNAKVKDSLLNVTHFDIIAGNPPYIRNKNIEIGYLLFLRDNFKSCESGNIDVYYAFIEFANKYSKRSSLIVPNSYLTNVSAKNLRKLIKPNLQSVRDFKTFKQFRSANTYTTILTLNKSAYDQVSYTNSLGESAQFKRDVLENDKWYFNKSYNTDKWKDCDTKLSDIVHIYSGINTNADKLFIVDKSTLNNGYYKKTYADREFLIEEDLCIDFIKISKRSSSIASKAIIFPYKDTNKIINEKDLSVKYPKAYKYFKNIKVELEQRDNGNTIGYESWFAYGRKQGFNVNFLNKRCYLLPMVYKKDQLSCEEYKHDKRFIHNSGFVLIPKNGYEQKVTEILKSNDFSEYLDATAKTLPGKDVDYNVITVSLLKNYPYESTSSLQTNSSNNNLEVISHNNVQAHLHNDDCIEVMDKMIEDDQYAQLIVMDPPYDIKNTNSGNNSSLSKSIQKTQDKLVKANITKGFDYTAVLDRAVKLQKGKVNIYIYCNKAQMSFYMKYFIDGLGCSFTPLVWIKSNPVPNYYNKYASDAEYILYFRKSGYCMPQNLEDATTLFLDPSNAKDNKKYGHPTVKYVHHLEKLIRNSSKPGDLVFDPFMGSGSTAEAALNLGRNFIGSELSKEYFNTSVKRITDKTPVVVNTYLVNNNAA